MYTRYPLYWDLTLDPNKKRWDTRTPTGMPLLEENGLSFLLAEDGTVLEEE